MQMQTMWDPARQMYSTWDDDGKVVDYPPEPASSTAHDAAELPQPSKTGRDAFDGEGEYNRSIDCESTDNDSSESEHDMEARFIAYYQSARDEGHSDTGAQVPDSCANRASGEQEDENEVGGPGDDDVIVSGDWVRVLPTSVPSRNHPTYICGLLVVSVRN